MLSVVKLPHLTQREVDELAETLDGYAEYFRDEIEQGDCELWEINNGDSFCITRLETDSYKDERITLVVCCYKGKDLDEFTEHLCNTADARNWFIRFHTFRPGLVRMMQKHDFNNAEYIAIRGPKHGK